VAAALLLAWAPPGRAQLAPPTTGGVERVDYLLQRLSEGRRVLLIGAHPDDEDNRLIVALSHQLGADVAYLSLSRGEGGQNLLGEELGVGLGLLRSRELEAARAIDGGRQYFTRAFDFGFTRSLDETETKWPRDSVLKDVIRVVRRFRPHVIVTMFDPASRGGHGQHQMSAVAAREAFDAAADPARFAELGTEEGLAPWRATRMYQTTRGNPASGTIRLDVGMADPRTGKTYAQLAAASRSRHGSQDMGQLQTLGPGSAGVAPFADRSDAAAIAAAGDRGDATTEAFFGGAPKAVPWLAALADTLRDAIVPSRLPALVPDLTRALARLRREGGHPEEARLLEETIAAAAGIAVDAVASSARPIPGDSLGVTVTVHDGGPLAAEVAEAGVEVPEGWRVTPATGAAGERRIVAHVPAGAPPTQPYFLRHPMIGDLYDWTGVEPAVKGELFEPPLITAVATVTIEGVPIRLAREVTYRSNDQATGEVRQPVWVVPRVNVRVRPEQMVWSSEVNGTRDVTVELRNDGGTPVTGRVRVDLDGWESPPSRGVSLQRPGETETVTFTLRRPASFTEGAVRGRAVVTLDDGSTYRSGLQVVEYPHVRPTPWRREATLEIQVAPIALPPLARVGYVRGASDRVPEALRDLGVRLTLLDDAVLSEGDLSAYDVIVIGSRAYETDPALVRANPRLLAYVEAGGHLVVQYQQYQFSGRYAPFTLEIGRPADRITDEHAPVRVLVPDHPVFTTPNRIDPADWDGWPQERGLYFAGRWDQRFTPLLEMTDPGLDPVRGALLVARYGRGTYVYTGISFFRSLPAGVPGAVRLFLNLLAWRG
jgi:LmbE family N-acetylglucosaminyl deacetylase